jgi:hypothetical protein
LLILNGDELLRLRYFPEIFFGLERKKSMNTMVLSQYLTLFLSLIIASSAFEVPPAVPDRVIGLEEVIFL